MIKTSFGMPRLRLPAASPSRANAQLVTIKQLSLPMAATIATTAIETCKAQGYNVSVHVIGNMGEVLVALRGDNTGPHTMENSMRKALTSRGQRVALGRVRRERRQDTQCRRAPAWQHDPGARRAADQGRPGHDRRRRRFRRAGRRQGRSLRQGRHRQGRRSAQIV